MEAWRRLILRQHRAVRRRLALAGGFSPDRPRLADVEHLLLAADDVIVMIRIRRLPRHLFGCHAEIGGVFGDVLLERPHLRREGEVGFGNQIIFGHSIGDVPTTLRLKPRATRKIG